MAGHSPKLPLQIDSIDGHYQLTKSLKEVLEQNLKMLVLTAPGERMMLPDFGAGLRNKLFENAPEHAIERDIRKQVSKYMPFIKIKNIIFERQRPVSQFGVKDNLLAVSIVYMYPAANIQTILKITDFIN